MRRKQVKYDLTEVDVGRAIKEANLFKNMEYAEEVGIGSSGSCDLVYFNDGEVYAIELKKQVNIKVMAQATRWLETASRVYVACPCTLSQDARQVLRTMGIGYIMVSEFQGILDDNIPRRHFGAPDFEICWCWRFKGKARKPFDEHLFEIRKAVLQAVAIVNRIDVGKVPPGSYKQRESVVIKVIMSRKLIKKVISRHVRIRPHLQDPVQPAVTVYLFVIPVSDHMASFQLSNIPRDCVNGSTVYIIAVCIACKRCECCRRLIHKPYCLNLAASFLLQDPVK